jgi:hypothetical protein
MFVKKVVSKLNIHINKTTRFQSWQGQTVFGEYSVYIPLGNFTVTLMFHDQESINRLCQLLSETIFEIQNKSTQISLPLPVKLRKSK